MAFMQANTSTHTLDDAKREMARLGLEPMPWPANSPDLNPNATIWFKIKQRIKAYADRPTCIQPLRDALQAE
jgi:transposase